MAFIISVIQLCLKLAQLEYILFRILGREVYFFHIVKNSLKFVQTQIILMMLGISMKTTRDLVIFKKPFPQIFTILFFRIRIYFIRLPIIVLPKTFITIGCFTVIFFRSTCVSSAKCINLFKIDIIPILLLIRFTHFFYIYTRIAADCLYYAVVHSLGNISILLAFIMVTRFTNLISLGRSSSLLQLKVSKRGCSMSMLCSFIMVLMSYSSSFPKLLVRTRFVDCFLSNDRLLESLRFMAPTKWKQSIRLFFLVKVRPISFSSLKLGTFLIFLVWVSLFWVLVCPKLPSI